MKKLYILTCAFLSVGAYGQIQQDINKNGGTTASNPINDVDSIRFNSGSTEMEVILNNGSMESHTISDIDNVTFSGSAQLYPPNYVHCGTPTAIVEVTNPTTNEIWMDRNLGATQAATSSTDTDAYGDLFQWGRFADGHQCRTSNTTTTLSTTDTPGHGDFITINSVPYDWRNPQNDNLWQGVNGTNNPCPSGFRLPTEAELDAEQQSWSSNDAVGAFTSQLKLPIGGFRNNSTGSIQSNGILGVYWSSTVNSTDSRVMSFNGSNTFVYADYRSSGVSVRCIKETGSQGEINSLDCGNANTIGTLEEGTAAAGVSINVDYTGGNGGTYIGQSITSTGVTGLTAQLSGGNFANGAGTLTYAISGTPASAGTATFPLNIGGQTCNLDVTVDAATPTYPPGYVHCGTPTAIVEVTNPNTGEIWMDRNLGASQVATSSTDTDAYGDLFQWGRFADGHQCRNSATTTTTSSTDDPGHGDFIMNSTNSDWRSPQNDNLWQGVNGTNNPCPTGFRIPTEAEFTAEIGIWSSANGTGGFNAPNKFTVTGMRFKDDGNLYQVGSNGHYWSSTISSAISRSLYFGSSFAGVSTQSRANGLSVRCIKNSGSQTPGTINSLDCGNANTIGTLEEGTAAAGVSINVDYTGGNGGTYTGQTITSTGVTGLTAQLSGGNFANGAGTLTYAISGTPASAGTATFPVTIGGQSCNLDVTVDAATPTYPPGYVHCGTPTAIVEVTNPTTNEVWMDRNLGAQQVATSSTDADAYGDLFQWGRFADGHQCRNSTAITTTSSTDDPGHGDFIRNWGAPYDWRIPQNDNLWQGVNGVNNPCPSGYRIPTSPELNAERQSWTTNDEAGAFGSPLKLSLAGYRDNANGSINDEGVEAVYWSSTVVNSNSGLLLFGSAFPAQTNSYRRARGYSVRCIKD